MKKILTTLLIILVVSSCYSQKQLSEHNYTRYDTLRGSITNERVWWDLLQYELSISVDTENQTIKGSNIIRYKTLESYSQMQIDLQSPLLIDKVYQDGKMLDFENDSSAYFIYLNKDQVPGEINKITIEFSGKPHIALNAPWDGGFTW